MGPRLLRALADTRTATSRPPVRAGPRALVLSLIALLAACGPGQAAPTPAPAPSTPAFGPRPASVSLTGLDPCTLLDSTAQHQLGVESATYGGDGNPTCQWSTVGTPVSNWRFELDTGYGADAGLAVSGAVITQVAGFDAAQTDGLDHGTSCRLWVDTAPGQSLNVLYSNSDSARRDMSHALACQLAKQAATLVLGRLTNLKNVPAGRPNTPTPDRPAPATAAAPAPAPVPAPPFPPRPVTLSLVGLDPCSLVSTAQAGQLGARIDPPRAAAPVNYCDWKHLGAPSSGTWTARLVTYRGAAQAGQGARFDTLDGFGVAETSDPLLSSEISCRVDVDVAPEQSLQVEYSSILNDNPAGMSHQLACARADQLARPLLRNLRAKR